MSDGGCNETVAARISATLVLNRFLSMAWRSRRPMSRSAIFTTSKGIRFCRGVMNQKS
jgi:hypothetical protein